MPEEFEPQDRPPSVSAPLLAALRQGAKELASILPAFPDSVHVVEEPGAMGNPTPQLVTEQISAGQENGSIRDSYAARAQQERDQSREQEMER